MKCGIITILLLEIALSGTCMAGSFNDLEQNATKLLRYDSKAAGMVFGMAIGAMVCCFNSINHFFTVSAKWKKLLCVAFIALGVFTGYRCIQAYNSLVSQINQYESAKVDTKSSTDEQEQIIREFMRGFLNQNPQVCMNYVLPSTKGNTYNILSVMSDSIPTLLRYDGFSIRQGAVTYELCDIKDIGENRMTFSYAIYINNSLEGICHDVSMIKTDQGWKIDLDSFTTAQLAMTPI